MKEMLDTVVFGGYTAQDVLFFAGGAAAFLMLILVLKRGFKKEEVSEYRETVDCSGCGWHGEVSRLAGRCPICNNTLGHRQVRNLPKKSNK